jgi:hypothetical protein
MAVAVISTCKLLISGTCMQAFKGWSTESLHRGIKPSYRCQDVQPIA